MNVTPAMGIIEVRRIKKANVSIDDLESILVFPNPTEKEIQIEFNVIEEGDVNVGMTDLIGRRVMNIIDEKMPAGEYKYMADVSKLDNGLYLLSIRTSTYNTSKKIIINK
jgi:hypothetical protein